jgi:cell division protein FtsB
MRIFGYWTVFIALCISAVAAYYSIVGLVAIFAAAAVPVIIMGSVLEVGKLTTAVWLHINGPRAGILIRSYLTIATLLLMFITSMGIFGFLSKAHIEQTSLATEGVAQLVRIESDISRTQALIARAEDKVLKLENSSNTADDSIQQRIDQEQARIDTAYDSVNPAIVEQQTIIDRAISQAELSLAPYTTELADIDSKISLIDQYVATNEIKKLQGLIGAKQDGRYGPGTAAAVQTFRDNLMLRRQEVLDSINTLRSKENPNVVAAREEIKRLRAIPERQILDGNELISRLRLQLGTTSVDSSAADITEQREIIKTANTELDKLFETKYAIEAEARKLEAEVGPVKYIAELVYGTQADHNMLEAAVRFVILILVMVFDPLAVVLVISGISLIEQNPRKNKKHSIPDTPAPESPETIAGNMFTEEQVIQYVEEALKMANTESAVINTDVEETPKSDTIVYQGTEYAPGSHDYQRVREQLELNNRLRNERNGIVKNPIEKNK